MTRSIERLSERGVITLPPLAEVSNDGPGPKFIKEYRLVKRDSLIVVAQLCPEFTTRIVDRWQELEVLEVCGVSIRQDADGRYCLNDLHRAAGGEVRHQPKEWAKLHNTKDMISLLENEGITSIAVRVGRGGGTFGCKELVYAYAMWISPKFNLTVIRAFDAVATGNLDALPASMLAAIESSIGAIVQREIEATLGRFGGMFKGILHKENESRLPELINGAITNPIDR